MSYVNIKEVTFSYSSKQPPILNKVTFSIDRGEIVGILGPSGSGKSTLLRLIAGLGTPDQGLISIADQVVVNTHTFIPPEERGVGMVFQDYALFPHLNVEKNIEFGLHRMSRAERKARLDEMVELVQLKGFMKRYPHELSGGQQQRVALARALAPKPSLLLMDEPFSNLDTELRSTIRSELNDILNRAKMTCLLVTHDYQDVKAICNREITL